MRQHIEEIRHVTLRKRSAALQGAAGCQQKFMWARCSFFYPLFRTFSFPFTGIRCTHSTIDAKNVARKRNTMPMLENNPLADKAFAVYALQVEIAAKDLAIPGGSPDSRARILAMAEHIIHRQGGSWKSQAVVRWVDVAGNGEEGVVLSGVDLKPTPLAMGYAAGFMAAAEAALLAVYTAGDEQTSSGEAADSLLDSYLLNLIGLAVLDKTGQWLNRMAEERARQRGWGVGPVLSPGAVHGWEIEDQAKICNLLPVDRIGVRLEKNSLLTPLQSVAAMIGIGPGYERNEVMPACSVCSRSKKCEMRKI